MKIFDHKRFVSDNILASTSIGDVATISEEQFHKAISSGLEVYSEEGLNKYFDDLQKAFSQGKIGPEDIEKANIDKSKLVKVIVVHKDGTRMSHWVKRGEEPKESERESKIDQVWWKMDKAEKNEYLTASRSKDSKKIAEFKERMIKKYSKPESKEEPKEEKKNYGAKPSEKGFGSGKNKEMYFNGVRRPRTVPPASKKESNELDRRQSDKEWEQNSEKYNERNAEYRVSDKEHLKNKENKRLADLGYQSNQIKKMSEKTRKEILDKNISGKNVSVMPDGSYRVVGKPVDVGKNIRVGVTLPGTYNRLWYDVSKDEILEDNKGKYIELGNAHDNNKRKAYIKIIESKEKHQYGVGETITVKKPKKDLGKNSVVVGKTKELNESINKEQQKEWEKSKSHYLKVNDTPEDWAGLVVEGLFGGSPKWENKLSAELALKESGQTKRKFLLEVQKILYQQAEDFPGEFMIGQKDGYKDADEFVKENLDSVEKLFI